MKWKEFKVNLKNHEHTVLHNDHKQNILDDRIEILAYWYKDIN